MYLQRFFYLFLIILGISSCGIIQKAKHQETSFDNGIKQIKHVVVIYMGNHSFDNLYGEFKGANGIENAKRGNFVQVDKDGNLISTFLRFRETTLSQPICQMSCLI